MTCNLREFKGFIDKEMIVILGQMDSPTEIFEHVFLVGGFHIYINCKTFRCCMSTRKGDRNCKYCLSL